MTDNDLTIRVMVEVRRRYKYDVVAKSEVELTIPQSSLTGMVNAIDALIHGMTVEVAADALDTLAMMEQEKSE